MSNIRLSVGYPALSKAKSVAVFISIAVLLTGCAGQMAYREGKNLVSQGKAEEALTKFQEALSHDPRDVKYRAAYLQTRDLAVISYLEQADRLLQNGESSAAEALYQRALVIDPNNDRARTGMRLISAEQRHGQLLKEAKDDWERNDAQSAQFKLRTILAENPHHTAALEFKQLLLEKTAPPNIESNLAAVYRKPITIEFKDVALKQVFEVISRTSGLNFLFDKDVKTDQKVSIFLKNSTIESAVHLILLTNQLEQQILGANTVLIYPNTAAKQKDYQEMVVKTFFLANAEAKSVANTLKTIVKTRDLVIDEKLNIIIVRDSPEAVRLAEKLVALHDIPEPEVMLEVEILEVKRTRLLELGIRWPDTLVLTPLPSSGTTLTLRDLQNNIHSNTIGAAIDPVTIRARKEDSDANILANPRIRARNKEKAKILIGERVPNITTTATSTGFVSESINYVDVGLKLEVEPTVHLDNEVAIKISLEVSNIVNQIQTKSGSIAYQIGTRTASTVLRLRDGENQVLAGLINDEDRQLSNKVPGIGELPIVGRLFGTNMDNNQKTEIVLSITPRLIRNIQRPAAAMSEFRAGTENSLRVRPDMGSHTPVVQQSKPSKAAVNNQAAPPSPTERQNEIPSPVSAAAGEGRLSWEGPAQSKVGETFTLNLVAQSGAPLTSIPLGIGFNSQTMQVVGIVEGDFLRQGGVQTSFTSRVGPQGRILMTGTRSGDGGAVGRGVVASIQFRALAPSEASPVQVLTATAVGLEGRSIPIHSESSHAVAIQP